MYKLAAAGFAFAAGIALAHYILPVTWMYYAAAACSLPLLLGLIFLKERRRAYCAIACAAAAIGLAWYGVYAGAYLGPAESFAGTTQTVTVRVDSYPYRDGSYASVSATLAEDGYPRLGVSVSDYTGTLPDFRPGDLAVLELEFTDAMERYGEPTDRYAARGVHLRAYFVSCSEVGRDWKSALYFPQELARIVGESISSCFSEDVRDYMLALLIGDTRGVYDDYELDNALSATGTAHVISVSGMHLSFLYSSVAMLAGKRRAAFIGAPLIVLFTFMAGCSSAIVRACVMLLLNMAAPLLRRESDGLTSLAFALIILLAANPLSIASASLQLSFASMLGLVTVAPALHARLTRKFKPKGKGAAKLRETLIASLSSSIGAIVFTTPIVAVLFGYVSLISPLANLLTLWAVSLAFSAGFAAAVIGAIVPLLGAAIAWLAAWPARYFILIIELLARIPFAAVYTADRAIVWWLVFTYAVFICAFAFRRGKPVRIMIPALCSAAVLLTALISAHAGIVREKCVTVLDVGQGESVALLSGESAVIVDCGGVGSWDDAGDTAGEYLLGRGRRSIDALVLTHLHSDHANGAARLISRIDVGTLYIPADSDDSDGQLTEILASAKRRGTEVVTVGDENLYVELPGMDLTLLAPVGSEDYNERGIVALASIGGYDAVITGDAGSGVERILAGNGLLPKSDLLVAGHHGSRYSNSFALIDAVKPETVVVSVGYNSYGHPTKEAMFRLSSGGAQVYRTDKNGDVTIRIDDDG